MTRSKYLLVIVTLVSWIAEFLLEFEPRLSGWSFFVSFGCSLAVIVCAVSALIRRKWNALAIFSLTLVIMFLPGFGVTKPSKWLQATGFRIHASPMQQYLSRCKLIAFVEDDTKQQVGECKTYMESSDVWITVFYDTTGQFVLPPARRTKGWTDAMYNFSPKWFFIETAMGFHIFENVYVVVIPLREIDRDKILFPRRE